MKRIIFSFFLFSSMYSSAYQEEMYTYLSALYKRQLEYLKSQQLTENITYLKEAWDSLQPILTIRNVNTWDDYYYIIRLKATHLNLLDRLKGTKNYSFLKKEVLPFLEREQRLFIFYREDDTEIIEIAYSPPSMPIS